jgi:C-terminal processing protease CtpA/Prc
VVGLFVSEVSSGKKEIQVGDQILEIAGQSAIQMSYCEAAELIAQAKDKLQLKLAQNNASEFNGHCEM